MNTYRIDVRHVDMYEIEADNAEEALEWAKNCVADNYGGLYFDGATFDVISINMP